MILIVAAFAATITSCQKQKLEKLSGTWVQIDKESTSSEFFPDEYYDVSFDCDSFSFKRKLCDDVYIVSCNCNCTEYIIKGTYKLEKSTLTLDGLYVELYDKYKNNPVPINYSNPDDKAPYYHQVFSMCYDNNNMILTKKIFDSKGNSKKFKKLTEVKCL